MTGYRLMDFRRAWQGIKGFFKSQSKGFWVIVVVIIMLILLCIFY